MRQLLRCDRCERMRMIDLGVPADLCDPCLRALGFPPEAGPRTLGPLDNASAAVEEGATWEEAVARERWREAVEAADSPEAPEGAVPFIGHLGPGYLDPERAPADLLAEARRQRARFAPTPDPEEA